jgi:cytochrome c-type biogenesis protein CcmH
MKYLLLLFILLASPVYGVDADEQFLPDAQQEQQARAIMKDLRCLVCRNESIVDSHADLARDLRKVVRERVAAGDSPEDVKRYMVSRYNEWILLKPAFSGLNILLWVAPLFLLFIGGIIIYRRTRGRVDTEGDTA